MPRHPFKSDYTEDSRTTVADTSGMEQAGPQLEQPPIAEQTATHEIDAYIHIPPSTHTPSVGKVYGTDKVRRVTIKGKISK